jgi:hypothetical protein
MLLTFYLSLIFISLLSATLLVIVLYKPICKLFTSLSPNNISKTWTRVLIIAIYVLSLYGGLDIDRIIGIKENDLSVNRWMMEIVNSIIHSLMNPLSMLIFLFMVCLVAIGVIRAIERNKRKKEKEKLEGKSQIKKPKSK